MTVASATPSKRSCRDEIINSECHLLKEKCHSEAPGLREESAPRVMGATILAASCAIGPSRLDCHVRERRRGAGADSSRKKRASE